MAYAIVVKVSSSLLQVLDQWGRSEKRARERKRAGLGREKHPSHFLYLTPLAFSFACVLFRSFPTDSIPGTG